MNPQDKRIQELEEELESYKRLLKIESDGSTRAHHGWRKCEIRNNELLSVLKEVWDITSHHVGPRIQELIEKTINTPNEFERAETQLLNELIQTKAPIKH